MSPTTALVTRTDWTAVISILPDPVVVVDADWRLRHANVPAQRLLGIAAAEGQSLLDAVPGLRNTPFERRLRTAAARRTSLRFPFRFSGSAHTGQYEVTATPRDGDFVMVEFRERPDRFDLEDQPDADRVTRGLVEAGIALSSASSLTGVLQVLVDVVREVVDARYAAMGVINAEGTGLSEFITSGLTPEQRARLGKLPTGHGVLGLLIREPHPIRLADLRDHPAATGTPRNHPSMRSFLGVPVSANGRVFGNLYVTEKIGADEFGEHDLALLETLAAQAAIAIENAQLRHERDRFFAAASHELGNSVAGVQVWARHLVRNARGLSDELADGLQKILKASESAHKLIQDLLSLSKIQEGRLTLTLWPTDVREVAADAIAHVWPDAEAAGVQIELLPAAERMVVEVDPMRLRQILVNLLTNAVKFSRAQGRVQVGFEREANGDTVTRVVDEGPGVAPEDINRIFMPYEQVSGVARGRGSGLGLPLSRQLARLMNGELWVESTPGDGSIFKLRLPGRTPPTAG
jgi:signal transduction histidine kinase